MRHSTPDRKLGFLVSERLSGQVSAGCISFQAPTTLLNLALVDEPYLPMLPPNGALAVQAAKHQYLGRLLLPNCVGVPGQVAGD